MNAGVNFTIIAGALWFLALVRLYAFFEAQLERGRSGHIPADLLSLLLPDGWQIVRAPEEVDHDAIAEACRAYLSAKEAAHRKDSPAQRDIADCEDSHLRALASNVFHIAA